jgi:hypothetical protein
MPQLDRKELLVLKVLRVQQLKVYKVVKELLVQELRERLAQVLKVL